MEVKTSKAIITSLIAVQKAIGEVGIAKDKNNDIQKYKFRGIDDVFNALNKLFSEHKIIVSSDYTNKTVYEGKNKSGGVVFYVTLTAEHTFHSGIDDSTFTVRNIGEAMDSSDKATNKAMSAAYKYAMINTFCIPVVGTPDADEEHIEVVSQDTKPTKQSKPKTMIDHLQTIEEIKAISDLEILHQVFTAVWRNKDNYTPEGLQMLIEAKDKQKAQLQALDDEIPH